MELLQKYHQGIRAEIETRGAKFTDCIDLGKALLTRKHRDSAEVGKDSFFSSSAGPQIAFFIRFNYFSGSDCSCVAQWNQLPRKKKNFHSSNTHQGDGKANTN